MVDMAHIAGLVAAGLHPSPFPHADIVTTTTHKTLRGPRGGVIMCKEKYAADIDRAVFPGMQGGPLMHIIAAKAACFYEAMQPEFKEYAAQVIKNAKALETALKEEGFRLVADGTDNHLILIDVKASCGISGTEEDFREVGKIIAYRLKNEETDEIKEECLKRVRALTDKVEMYHDIKYI